MPNKKTINFDCGWIDGDKDVDSGGYSYYYLRDNPQAQVASINQECLSSWSCIYEGRDYTQVHTKSIEELEYLGYDDDMSRFIKSGPHDMEVFLSGTFLHYAGACNWMDRSADYHASKTRLLYHYVDGVVSKQAQRGKNKDEL
jgi:hypothetical protein